jgi:hypothetical protein
MRFDHHSILQNFQFLKESIQALDESYFPYRDYSRSRLQECQRVHLDDLFSALKDGVRPALL